MFDLHKKERKQVDKFALEALEFDHFSFPCFVFHFCLELIILALHISLFYDVTFLQLMRSTAFCAGTYSVTL